MQGQKVKKKKTLTYLNVELCPQVLAEAKKK